MPHKTDHLTTLRCIRLSCAMTVRLLDPIDRCPRCRARMFVLEQPAVDPNELVADALQDVLAGFDHVLAEAAHVSPSAAHDRCDEQ
jgi:hypothetical protein